MVWMAWIVLIGGFLFGREVLHLELDSPERAVFGVILCSVSGVLAWLGYKSRKASNKDFKYALAPLIVAGIGALYFLTILVRLFIPAMRGLVEIVIVIAIVVGLVSWLKSQKVV